MGGRGENPPASHRRARFAGTRLAHRQRASLERLAVELLDRALGDTTIVVIDESEAARPPRVAISGNDDLHRVADRAKVLPDVCFGRDVGKISDE